MTMLTKPEDFIERTKINLTLYFKKRYQEQNEKKDGAEYELEVTQILNSFLGIIVVPYEEEKTSSWKTLIPNDLQQKMTLLPTHKQPATLGELCEELRRILWNQIARLEKLLLKIVSYHPIIFQFLLRPRPGRNPARRYAQNKDKFFSNPQQPRIRKRYAF